LALTLGGRRFHPMGEGAPKLAIRFAVLDRTRKRGR
jgi:hypothetical protein